MSTADIEERLRSHAQAFDGLLSLIPAKYYYGEDTSDQWQRKKQTKEQARNAKRAKLDPDSAKTAKDVMDENARKRKRDDEEEEEDNDSDSSVSELGSELPREGMKRGNAKAKKLKQSDSAEKEGNTSKQLSPGAEERRRLKAEKKAQKKAAQRERKKAKEAAKKEKAQEAQKQSEKPTNASQVASKSEEEPNRENDQHNSSPEDNDGEEEVVAPVEGFTLDSNSRPPESASTASSNRDSPGFDVSNDQSGSSSISSVAPSNEAADTTQKPASEPKPLKPTPEELRQRLQKRLEELRAARHADGLNGKPARNRQELIEARRQKAEQRKQHKKEMRRKAKEEEQRKKDEEMARRFSPGGAGSLLASPRSPAESNVSGSNNYAFGRITFADGQLADPSGTRILDKPKQHGPQDPGTALKAAEAKKARLAAMDPAKRAEIEEKDMWLNAKKKAHGEKVRDDTSLLKKALKRKAAAKRKSEREWKERLEGVAKNKEMRQKQREENIRKRKEEKKAGKKGKAKARPGFEGSFKAKVGGKKK
ncbi:hypothetical protein VTN77DRAFT_1290 [Rasamsonia byssochlamydoides]|uniref:uncharacterized protein n=1 Tax=Rasamsonia byssochlamydoides TaxID=89139 RepID=UPI003742C150